MAETRLFVGNLPGTTEETELQSEFTKYGKVSCIDLKSKAGADGDSIKFAFITLCSTPADVESCIKHYANNKFKGTKLYVSIARESFLERLQRERQQAKNSEKPAPLPTSNPKINLGTTLNPPKRKIVTSTDTNGLTPKQKQPKDVEAGNLLIQSKLGNDKKKTDSDLKRLESMKKKREEFKQKKLIIKTGFVGIDKAPNKKIVFSENQDTETNHFSTKSNKTSLTKSKGNALFDDDESDKEVNFEIKKQYEGKKGQKVLELQSKYKSDKRFVLDKRFVDDDDDNLSDKEETKDEAEEIDEEGEVYLDPAEEKAKQLNILQDVLGVAIKTHRNDPRQGKDAAKTKPKLGMTRFDPTQPGHAKYLALVDENNTEKLKKSKKKKNKEPDVEEFPTNTTQENKIEVSKEQFYTISDTLKEAITQPNTFSLLSMFGKADEDQHTDKQDQDTGFIPLEVPKEKKIKNPFDTAERNPFKYDSSDSETEDVVEEKKEQPPVTDIKPVWRETLFFIKNDERLKDGLAFFNKTLDNHNKDRRELKSLMKKRLYNKDRKDQMFKKKIGGKSKTKKKNFRRKN